MDGIIGRVQTEADERGRRTDIQFETNVGAIKSEDGTNIKEAVQNMGLSVTMSQTTPTHSSLLIIPD